MHGESVVMRILDREAVVLDFHTLGFTDEFLPKFIKVLEQPHGILLVTGPTGSGKTTTLYTALSQLNTPDVKIITVEDPVEYQIDRHQPDPGQAADRPRLRARAALDRAPGPGHHHDRRNARPGNRADRDPVGADRPPGAVDAAHQQRRRRRHALLDMGVEDYLLTSTVNGILAQRLVRRLDARTRREATKRCRKSIEEFGLRRFQPKEKWNCINRCRRR